MVLDLKNITEKTVKKFDLTSEFFKTQEGSEICGGEVEVELTITKKPTVFELQFVIDGSVSVECHRCLEPMELPISVEETINVKFGTEYFDDGSGTILIDGAEGTIDIDWIVYEFVGLQIPAQHVHADEADCNQEMLACLAKCDASNEAETKNTTDPRWEKLKDITNI